MVFHFKKILCNKFLFRKEALEFFHPRGEEQREIELVLKVISLTSQGR